MSMYLLLSPSAIIYRTYLECLPSCINYSMRLRMNLNEKLVSKDAEPDLVLNGAASWHDILKFRVGRLMQKR